MESAQAREIHRMADAAIGLVSPDLDGDIELFPIAGAALRRRVGITGVVRDMRERAAGSGPILECTLEDASGSVTLRFLGRSTVPGVEAGRRLVVEGTIGCEWSRRVVWNPLVKSSW